MDGEMVAARIAGGLVAAMGVTTLLWSLLVLEDDSGGHVEPLHVVLVMAASIIVIGASIAGATTGRHSLIIIGAVLGWAAVLASLAIVGGS